MESVSLPRVVILAPSTNRNLGGVERFSSVLADVLRDRFDVTVLPAPGVSSTWARRLGVTGLLRSGAAREQIAREKPDVVITNGTLGAVGRGPWKRVHVYHGTMPQHAVSDREQRRIRDWLLSGLVGGGLSEFASGVGARKVAVSESARSEVRRWFGFRNVCVIENAVTIDSHVVGDSSRRGLVFVGRRESRKGYSDAVEVAARLGMRLRVAGPGSDDRTNDLGILDETEVRGEFMSALAFIFPSRYEACSLAILEAMASGCPVVTTRVGWMATLLRAVPEYEQLTADVGDADRMAEIVMKLEKGDAEIWQAVAGARAWVRSHNALEQFSASWSALIAETVAMKRGRAA